MTTKFDPKIGLEHALLLSELNNEIIFNSDYNFLKEHKGIRPGKLHLFIARSHGGKSTMVRSLFFDIYKNLKDNERVGVWFTEETEQDFATEMIQNANYETILKRNNYNFFSELDHNNFSEQQLLKALDDFVESSDIVLFDNLTTSTLYADKPTSKQGFIAGKLKEICKKHYKPIIIMAHTDSSIHSNQKMLIQPNQIRGSKQIINLTEFLYVLQSIYLYPEGVEKVYSFLVMHKYRGQGKQVKNRMFGFKFNNLTQTYEKDFPLDMEAIKKAFKDMGLL